MLIKGEYHVDEDDEEDEAVKFGMLDAETDDKIHNLNRAMRGGDPNAVQHELKMDDFEQIKENLINIHERPIYDERTLGDHVPKKFKDEFNLPKDMKNLTIDFLEVRKVDAQFKKRKQIWSG